MPSTYIDSGTVASERFGASVAPTIEPVAKMTAELAPVSACAAASRRTLPRARASSAVSSVAVASIIAFPPGPRREPLFGRTMKSAGAAINRCKQARAMQGAHIGQRTGKRLNKAGLPDGRLENAQVSTMPIDDRPTLAAPDDDPYLWLEDIEGARALDFVEAQNRRTLQAFGGATFAADRDALAAIYDRPD